MDRDAPYAYLGVPALGQRAEEVLKGQGCLLCLFCVLPATPGRKTLFEKNFLDLSVEGRLLGRLRCLFSVLPATSKIKNFL